MNVRFPSSFNASTPHNLALGWVGFDFMWDFCTPLCSISPYSFHSHTLSPSP